MKSFFKFITLSIIALTLASCASKPSYSPSAVSDAEELYLTKQYTEAAIAFNQQAAGAVGTGQSILLLRSVIAFLKAEQYTQAIQLFQTVTINENDRKQKDLSRLTRAHIALVERNAEEVLLQLNEPLSIGSQSILLAEFHELRAAAFSMQGDRITTAEEYILQGNYLSNNTSILQSQHLIWESLSLLSERSLQQLQPSKAPDVLSGWMELVRFSKKYQLNPTLLRRSIDNWQRHYSDHPVHTSLLEGLRNRKQEDVSLPKKIALLLPLSGRFANAAKAIRDGLLASYYAKKEKQDISIRVYDTKGQPELIEEIYEKAVADGAQFIIGPLNKSSIKTLTESQELSIPTLALNYITTDDSLPQSLYQFGLSPEEEARQVAERTWLDGHVNAAVLTPAVHGVIEYTMHFVNVGNRLVEK